MLSTAKQEAWTPESNLKAEPGRMASRRDLKDEHGSSSSFSADQPGRFVLLKRIGSTNYRVAVHFSETSTETLDDKIVRLIKREASGT